MPKEYHPDTDALRKEWHPTKNGTTKFDDLKQGASQMVWWLGECTHEWETKHFLRAARGAACPICTNRKLLVGFNDIATVYPELVSDWSPHNILPISESIINKKNSYKWLCSKEAHGYESTLKNKLSQVGCPICQNRQLLTGYNDLATTNPELADEWHPTANGELTPTTVLSGGAMNYWWKCEKGHEWETTIRHRKEGSGCLSCSGRQLIKGETDLATLFPEIAAEWHPTLNGDLKPEDIFGRSSKIVWWKCPAGHEWQKKILTRTVQNNSCKDCSQKNRLYSQKKFSLADSEAACLKEWHPTKNGDLTPSMVSAGSSGQVWWLGECGHEWKARVFGRVSKGYGCSFCKGKLTLAGENSIDVTNPDIASELHPTENDSTITAQTLRAGSNKSVSWLCAEGHTYKTTPYKRISMGRNCSVCSGHNVVDGVNDLTTVNPELAAEWHPTLNGDLLPSMVTGKGGRVRAVWLCKKGHDWEASVKGRLRGRGCPQCWAKTFVSTAEQELHDFIVSLDPAMVVVQSDKKVLRGKELDIYIPEKKLAVEFNGLFWHSEKAGKDKNYHYGKWLACKEQGIQLVQVWEDDWVRDSGKVKQMIAHKLGLSSQRKVFARKTVVTVVDKNTAEVFLEKNHIQGWAAGSYYVGLKDADKVLVALLVLKKADEGKVLDIVRYATAANVVGGFTKLLVYAEKTYKPEAFITFADHCVSDGGLYESNGFFADKFLIPDYMYIVDGVRKHKFGYRLQRFMSDPDLLWEDGLSEKNLADLNDLERIWDAGKTRYRKAVLS